MSLNWGVVGCGRIATEQTIPAILGSKKANLVAVMSRTPENAKAVAEQFGIDCWYADLDEFLSNEAIDVVYVATPNADHVTVATRAAQCGKHVLCEKPMGANQRDCEEMVEVCQGNGVRLMVAQMSHFNAYNRRAEEIVRSGALGNVVIGRSYNSLLLPDRNGWRFDLMRSGSGALMDIGVYCVHTLRTVIPGEVESVTAQVSPVPRGRVVDDRVAAIMKFDTGADALLDCGFDYYSGNICNNEARSRGEGNGYQVAGNRGVVTVTGSFSEGEGGTISAVVDGQHVDTQVQPGNPYLAEVNQVVDCIENDLPSELDGTVGLADVRVMMAIYESGRRNETVRITRD